jgi:uncharacterized protein (TIGR02284 family)
MKEILSKDAVDTLNLLIEKNFNTAKEYKMAAGNAFSPALRGFLNDYALQRDQFAVDLCAELLNSGKKPLKNGDKLGQIPPPGWFDLELAFSQEWDQAVLKECVIGESTSLGQYRRILKDFRFSPATERLLRNQQLVVENANRRIKQLEKLFDEERSGGNFAT